LLPRNMYIHSDGSAWHHGTSALNISYGFGTPTRISALRDSGKDQLPVRLPGASLIALGDVLSNYRLIDVPKVTIAHIFNAKKNQSGHFNARH
jgi:hypothetical protein